MSNNTQHGARAPQQIPTHTCHAAGYMNVPVVMGTDEEQTRVRDGEAYVWLASGTPMICYLRELSAIDPPADCRACGKPGTHPGTCPTVPADQLAAAPRDPDGTHHYDARTIAAALRALADRLDAMPDPAICRTWVQVNMQVTQVGRDHGTAAARRATVDQVATHINDGVTLVDDSHRIASFVDDVDGVTFDIYTPTGE